MSRTPSNGGAAAWGEALAPHQGPGDWSTRVEHADELERPADDAKTQWYAITTRYEGTKTARAVRRFPGPAAAAAPWAAAPPRPRRAPGGGL